MKFTIHGFNQSEILKINNELGLEVKLKREPNWQPNTEDIVMKNGKTRKRPEPKLPKISNNELLVLRWFVDFFGTKKMTKIELEGQQYVWVNYSQVLEDLPILDINKTNLYNIFINLVDFKILKHNTSKNGNGTFSVYYFGENFDRLIYNDEIKEGLLKSIEGSIEINRPKNPNTINPNTINNTIINNSIMEKSETPFSRLNNNIEEVKKPKKKTQAQLNAIKRNKILEEFIKDEDDNIKKALRDYVEVRKSKGLHPEQLQIILEDFKKEYNNKPQAMALEQIRKATARGWSALVFKDTFKGIPKVSYESKPNFDNTINHNIEIYHISDAEFDKLTHEEKLDAMNKFSAIKDMTEKQREFHDKYCLARDKNGNLEKF